MSRADDGSKRRLGCNGGAKVVTHAGEDFGDAVGVVKVMIVIGIVAVVGGEGVDRRPVDRGVLKAFHHGHPSRIRCDFIHVAGQGRGIDGEVHPVLVLGRIRPLGLGRMITDDWMLPGVLGWWMGVAETARRRRRRKNVSIGAMMMLLMMMGLLVGIGGLLLGLLGRRCLGRIGWIRRGTEGRELHVHW